jgi:NTP pyrophosphatase (non-canonical NTP hydrolase)
MSDELIHMISLWAMNRGIINNSTPLAQFAKLVSEIGELGDNVAKQRDVTDDIGDCLVVLNNLAIMNDTTLEECLKVAYNDIKDRKGHMNSHGVFIKEGDAA